MTDAMERMSTKDPPRRRTQWKSCEDSGLDRGIRPSVESASRGDILRRKGARGVNEEHAAGDESFVRLNGDSTTIKPAYANRKLIVRYFR